MHRRRSIHFFSVLALGAAVSGCNCVGRELTLTRTFQVRSDADDGLCSIYQSEVNLGADETFNNLKNNIGRVELRKLVVTVTEPNVDNMSQATKANGKVRITSPASSTPLQLGTYEDVPLTKDASQTIPFDATAASTLANLALNPPNTFNVNAEGCNDRVPAWYDFQVAMTIYAELKLF